MIPNFMLWLRFSVDYVCGMTGAGPRGLHLRRPRWFIAPSVSRKGRQVTEKDAKSLIEPDTLPAFSKFKIDFELRVAGSNVDALGVLIRYFAPIA
jgi:hypothetical protein